MFIILRLTYGPSNTQKKLNGIKVKFYDLYVEHKQGRNQTYQCGNLIIGCFF